MNRVIIIDETSITNEDSIKVAVINYQIFKGIFHFITLMANYFKRLNYELF